MITIETGKLLAWDVESTNVTGRQEVSGVRQCLTVAAESLVITVAWNKEAQKTTLVAYKLPKLVKKYDYEFDSSEDFYPVTLQKGENFMTVIIFAKSKLFLQPIHVRTGTPLYKIRISAKVRDPIENIRSMPHNANQIALICAEKAFIWDIKNKRLLRILPHWNGECTIDGHLGLHAPMRGGLELLEMKKGNSVRRLIPRAIEGVNDIRAVFTADSRHVLYYHSGQGTLRIFRTTDGQEIACFRPHAELTAFASSPDGHRLVIGGVDGSVLVMIIVDTESSNDLEFLAKQPTRKALAEHLHIENLETEEEVYTVADLKAVGKAAAKFKELTTTRREQRQRSSTCTLQ